MQRPLFKSTQFGYHQLDMVYQLSRFLRLLIVIIILSTGAPTKATALTGNWNSATSHPQNNFTYQAQSIHKIEIRADSFGLPISEDQTARYYAKPSVFLRQDDRVRFDVTIEEDGVYNVAFDMAAGESFINAPEGQLLIDGAFPSNEAQHIAFPIFYKNSADKFPLNRYGNEALIRQIRLIRWSNIAMRDASFSLKYPVQVNLTKGEHTFEFGLNRESMYLGSIYIESFTKPPDYSTYLANNQAPDSAGVSLAMEAEFPTYKNSTSVRPANSRSLEVTPYDTYRLLMNTLGGETWKNSGSAVYYKFTVPEDGMYYITLRTLQNTKNNSTVFRRITINDEVLFDELNEVPFKYSTHWENTTLGGDTPYRFHLKKGTNVLGIEANNSPYYTAIERIKQALNDINTLSLEINRLTGNQVDRYKEWVISDYIPDIGERLTTIANELQADKEALAKINRTEGSQEILTYQMAIDNMLFLIKDPDKIPIYMNRFSKGSGSAAQLLGGLLPTIQGQPLALDKIYVHSPDTEPQQKHIPIYVSFVDTVKRFVHSFKPDPYLSIRAEEGQLEVWVNRPRQYVDLMQTITDELFTPETGINVKYSVMPDESKLILANAANIQPDVALGVSTDRPYELAIRNALKDLRSFADFDSFIKIYTPGSLLSYIINDSVYAIPETQDFWVTFYRKDILDSLGIPIPKTWNEVIEILPELQRYGMNYNTPLSSGGTGFKNYIFTSPYIFNFNAQLYSPDGFSTGLSSDAAITAIKFMAESFTIYGMPLTTSSFYDSFRNGRLPIGVSNFTDYVKLVTAAPELNGLWGIDLYPAIVLKDGSENRYTTGSAQSAIMFANTDKPNEAWEFMKWWMSTDTQVDFEEQLILNYGYEYLWTSANLEAFGYSPMPEEHKAVILQQWQWLQEPVKLPGSYMQERELSNAWNRIVFDGVNPRVAIDNSVIIINREITRKMEEFGYLENGVKVKAYKVPSIETVEEWMANAK